MGSWKVLLVKGWAWRRFLREGRWRRTPEAGFHPEWWGWALSSLGW